uniref:Uncharacterized protein n=1 Tax=Pristionchus pacificus TaxID=54126 RepID=A0A2A6CSS1_PRIPA|eukprot:PDM81117.1 hypothetical protein PRIPAC_36120 [Pristionchus pacificus]
MHPTVREKRKKEEWMEKREGWRRGNRLLFASNHLSPASLPRPNTLLKGVFDGSEGEEEGTEGGREVKEDDGCNWKEMSILKSRGIEEEGEGETREGWENAEEELEI